MMAQIKQRSGASERPVWVRGNVGPSGYRSPGSLLDWVAILGGCGLILAFALAAFAGRGAFGTDELYGIGRLWAITEILMLAYVLRHVCCLNLRTPMIALMWIWLSWVSCTCLQLFQSGISAIVRGLLQVLYCPLFFFFFYIVGKRRPSWTGLISHIFTLVLVFCCFMFWKVFGYQNSSFRSGSALLNDVYYPLLILPFVLITPEQWLRYGGMALVSLVTFWSMKRTAFAVLLASMLAYFVIDFIRLRGRLDWRWMTGIALAAVIGVSLFNYVGDSSGGFFISRVEAVEQDRGSRRLDIYEGVLSLQANALPTQWILGHGHNSVLTESEEKGMLPTSAHNDWQEVLFDYGLPGFFLYAIIHLQVIRLVWRFVRRGSEFAPALAASYVIFLLMSLASHLVLYASYFSYLMAFWGLAVAVEERSAFDWSVTRRRREVER